MEWNEFQFLHRKPSGIDRVGTVVSGPQRAFTLAEVLITLAIIGVVAALTIPTVVRNYTEKQTVVQLKKVYSQLNSAFQMAVVENGAPETWDWGVYNSSNNGANANNIMQKYFIPHLKILKNCGRKNDGCFLNKPITNLKGNKVWAEMTSATDWCSMVKLADGTSVCFSVGEKCNQDCSRTHSKPLNKYCGQFLVDLNGNKGPQKMGIDVFLFSLTNFAITPAGIKDDWCASRIYCDKSSDQVTSGCAAWVLQHENMGYLQKDYVCTGSGGATGYDCHLE